MHVLEGTAHYNSIDGVVAAIQEGKDFTRSVMVVVQHLAGMGPLLVRFVPGLFGIRLLTSDHDSIMPGYDTLGVPERSRRDERTRCAAFELAPTEDRWRLRTHVARCHGWHVRLVWVGRAMCMWPSLKDVIMCRLGTRVNVTVPLDPPSNDAAGTGPSCTGAWATHTWS
jgi:hypothetical protein